MAKQLLTERFALEPGKVGGTAEAPVIEGVLLCGPVSANKRRYLKKAFEGDRVKRYNGKPVKITVKHGEANGFYQEEIGTVENARLREDGMPVGDLAINPKKPLAEAFLWDATHKPRACGISHVIDGDVQRASDGWDEVHEAVEVHSVDVIGAGRAATTKGLFEGKTVPNFSLKQFSERFGAKLGPTTWGALAKLCEDYGAVSAAPVMDAPADGAEPADLKSALIAALTPMLDDAFDTGDPAKLIAALKDFIKLHAKHTGKTDAEPPPAADAASEAKAKTTGALLEALDLCTAAKFAATRDDLEVIAATPAAGRAKRIEQLKKLAEGTIAEAVHATGRDAANRLAEAERKKAAEAAVPSLDELKKRIKA